MLFIGVYSDMISLMQMREASMNYTQRGYHVSWIFSSLLLLHSGKAWEGETLANLLFLSIWRKKVLQMNRSANRLSIVTTNLDDFSLANHG